MKLQISYIENDIIVDGDTINCLEIENKTCFYRLVDDLYLESNGELTENLMCFDELGKEVNISNKFMVIVDYFNLDLIVKKYSSLLEKNIIMSINEKDKLDLVSISSKLVKVYEKIISDIDLPLKINFSNDMNYLVRIMKPSFLFKKGLLENLLLLVDIEKIFKLNRFLVFVNLKQYLNKNELFEFYKYTIYSDVAIILIDSQSYGVTMNYEKKIVIDSDYEEFVL